MRLNKYLVEAGLADSRRKADEAIKDGKVSIDGRIAVLGDTATAESEVYLNGQQGQKRNHVTIAFNKPVGLVSSHTKQGVDETLFSLLPKTFAHLKIAGRLDKDSQGLVILSSDGELIQKLSHPSSGKEKEYIVLLHSDYRTADTKTLLNGIKLDDGLSKFVSVKQLSPRRLRVILQEGRNRQIRRSFNELGYKVALLERIRIGDIELSALQPGKYIFLHNLSKV